MESRRPETVTFPGTAARFFRLLVLSSYTFGKTEGTWNAQVAEIALLRAGERAPAAGLRNWELKSSNRGIAGPMPEGLPQFDEEDPDAPGEADARSEGVVDLTGKVGADGTLTWDVPEGCWTVLRLGSVLLPQKTRCASPGTQGLEIDVLSAEAMDRHFAATAEKLIADAGPLAGKTLKYLHIDSYEIGADLGGQQPTWTRRLREEFRARRGYDPLPWLPVLARKIVDGREASNRFLRDYRLTIADLIAENYYGRLRELAARHGLGTHSESGYGSYPLPTIDGLRCAGLNDIPMGEFWKRQSEPAGPIVLSEFAPFCDVIRTVACAAHAYGRPICQAEAFTSMGPNWEEDFHDLKDVGDRAFCAGLTRNVLCFYVHQPRLDVKPGYQWEAAGTHFDRNVTWWDRIGAWTAYLTRCQHLLRQGVPAADICYHVGEDVPVFVPARAHLRPRLPAGRDGDSVNAEVLLGRMSVRDGRVVLPEGTAYRLLVLPERPTMSPPVLRKIRELVEGGATVVGPKPRRAPGLTGYPRCDEEVRELADALWGPGDGPGPGGRRVGKGRVFTGTDLEAILAADGIPPDLEVRDAAAGCSFEWIHRSAEGAEIWFVSNQVDRPEKATVLFRAAGRQPEIWDPLTGRIRDATDWRVEGGRTAVPLEFAPRQSWFVLFRRPGAPPERPAPNFPAWRPAAELAGPWTVRFDPRWGGPEAASFERLEDWSRRPEEGIRHYSGTATYRIRFDLPEGLRRPGTRVALDLGTVKDVAAVRLNEKDLGTVWTAPRRIEIAGAARPEGNELEIDVTNLWPNRLIGDAGLPKEKRLTTTNVGKFKADTPLLPSGLLGPVALGALEQEAGSR